MLWLGKINVIQPPVYVLQHQFPFAPAQGIDLSTLTLETKQIARSREVNAVKLRFFTSKF
jgi:hypothetical protein